MDIKRKLAKIIVKKVILLVILSLFLIACMFYTHELADYFYVKGSIFLSILILLIYLRISGLWRIICDKSWEGTVVNIRCEEAREPVTFAHAVDRTSRGIPKMIKYTVITAELPDGKCKKLRFPCRELDVNVFRVGDKIIHYKGMKYPQNPCRKNEIHMCPSCGRFLNDNYCPDCKFNF
jgi:hypothetical protein